MIRVEEALQLIDKAYAVEVAVDMAANVTVCVKVDKDEAKRVLSMLPPEQLIVCSTSNGGYLTIGD